MPFTPNGKATELQAIGVKRHLGLPPRHPVDPFAILADVPARLLDVRSLATYEPIQALLDHCNNWSGLGLRLPEADDEFVIVLNPDHSLARQRATLMEEIVHIVLGHPMSTIERSTPSNGSHNVVSARTHNRAVEDEAFCVGAACLLPYPHLFNAIRERRETVDTIASDFGVSAECVRYRVKRAGLTGMYKNLHGRL